MTKLIALLALAGAVAAAVFFWRKNEGSWEAMWSSTTDTTSSWSKTVAHEASNAADAASADRDDVTHAVPDLADDITGATEHATHEVGKATKKGSAATTEDASKLADELTAEPDTSH
jgi:hypothetical protein